MRNFNNFLHKNTKLVLAIFSTTIIISIFLYVLFLIDTLDGTIYRMTYVFTKVSANNISQIVSSPEVISQIEQYSYEPYEFQDYKKFQSTDVFVLTPEYIKILDSIDSLKYKTAYYNNTRLESQINSIIDAYKTLEHVKNIFIIDKSGYIAFTSKPYRGTITGKPDRDKEHHIINVIYPQLTADVLNSNYVTDYYSYIKETKMRYTLFPIQSNNKTWAHLVVVYDNGFFKENKKLYMKKATILCIIIIVIFGLIIRTRKVC